MEKRYIQVASIPDNEKIVAVTRMGGWSYWNFKFPFKHFTPEHFFVATEKAVYEVTPLSSSKGDHNSQGLKKE